jgi:pimeloyl-[acyl-carrier protein] methyl ester esterase
MSLYTTRTGSGPALVMVHGWGFHGAVWEQSASALAAEYRVLRPDLPGHGRSAPTTQGLDAELTVRQLAEQLPEPAVWLGWSLGGTLALRLAIAYPQRVRGLVLVAASPCFCARSDWPHGVPQHRLQGFAADLERDWRSTLVRFLLLHSRGAAGARVRALRDRLLQHPPRPEALRAGLSVLEQEDLRPLLGQVRCPVLVIGGERDPLVPAAGLPLWTGGLPRARMEVLPLAGHMPFLSHFEVFQSLLCDFLDSLDTPPCPA